MWTNDIESIVFTRIKNKVGNKLKNKYPELHFTNSDIIPKEPKFPTVYIHELSGSETDRDMEGAEINSVLCSFQIEVTDNISQVRAKDVMNEVMKLLKEMKFGGNSLPEFQNRDGYFKSVARFRRTIGKHDIL